MGGPMGISLLIPFFLLLLFFTAVESVQNSTVTLNNNRRETPSGSLCTTLIEPYGFPCTEHITQTEDGYLLGLQRVSASSGIFQMENAKGPPVLLVHGLFMAGDAWFLDTPTESLGFILADRGLDVWVANVRGTRWSHGHISFSEKDKEFWDWSWQELALYDLDEITRYICSITDSKIYIVGHSQGTIMTLAALTQPDIAKRVEGAALLCPISYLDHVTAPLVLDMVKMRLDDVILALGIHELNFKSDFGTHIMDLMCDGRYECGDMLTSITGGNCCFNNSRVDFYLTYEPHPSSSKNLNHLFQMIRKGTFAMYDYGVWKNFANYGKLQPPAFDLSKIPKSVPLWMGYGGADALADVTDVERTLKELPSKPYLLYHEEYGHIDFLLSVKCKEDVYDNMIEFFESVGKHSSY